MTLAHLHDHNCLVRVLGYLSVPDLNSLSECSRRYHDICTQERNLVIEHPPSILDLYEAIITNRWSSVFSGIRKRLVIKGGVTITRDKALNILDIKRSAKRPGVVLEGVTSLVLSPCSGGYRGPVISFKFFYGLALILPNLRTLDLSNWHMRSDSYTLEQFFCHCPNLSHLILRAGTGPGLSLSSYEHFWDHKLTTLCLDGSELSTNKLDGHHTREWEEDEKYHLFVMMMARYTRIERLSIQSVTWRSGPRRFYSKSRPLTQKMIIELVRKLPHLSWLRSDYLSPENITILQRERAPEDSTAR